MDGLPEVLSASKTDHKIAVYENGADGPVGGRFGPQTIISDEAIEPVAVFAVDLDGDSLADVLSASLGGGVPDDRLPL